MSNEKWSEWIEHDGVRCPLPINTPVEVEFRDGSRRSSVQAMYWAWKHKEQDGDIIAYRYKIKEPESDMHPDLEWLARNVSEWPKGAENIRLDKDGEVCFSGAKIDDEFDFYVDDTALIKEIFRKSNDGGWTGRLYGKSRWLQARQQLGLDQPEVTSEEEEAWQSKEREQSKSSGGDNDYWIATVNKPKRLEPYQAECEDLIELFQMTFQEGEAFKALWRKGQLRIGNGKPGDTLLRNSEKAYHYSGRMVAMESE